MAVPKSSTPPGAPKRPAAASVLAAAMEAPPSESLGASDRIAAKLTPQFFLAHSADGWEAETVEGEVGGVALKGVYWLPVLSMLLEVPGGMPGMRTRRQGEAPEKSYADAIDLRRRAGWAVLDRTKTIASVCLPAGVPEGPYIRRLPCMDPKTGAIGYHYLEAWKVPVRTSPGRPQAFKFDRRSYNLWRASLVLSGVIDEPTEDVIAPIVRQASAKVDRVSSLALPDDVRKLMISRASVVRDTVASASTPAAS